MEPFKVNIDRPKLSDEAINKHQNFDKVLDAYKKGGGNSSTSATKYWLWGSIGLAVVAGLMILFFNNPTEHNKETLAVTETEINEDAETIANIEKEQLPAYKKSVTFLNKNGFSGRVKKDTKLAIAKNSFAVEGALVLKYVEEETNEDGTEFFIEVNQNNNPVLLQKAKTIDVTKQVENAGQYELAQLKNDEFHKIATYSTAVYSQGSTSQGEITQQPEISKPIKASAGKKQIVLNLLPEDFPEFSNYTKMMFEPLELEAAFDESIFNIEWNDIELIKKQRGYEIKLQKLDSVLKLEVMPVYSEKDYEQAMEKYNALVKEKEPVDTPQQPQNYQVTFSLKETGTYRIKNKLGS